MAHCLIGHSLSQKGVFAPATLHPVQLIILGVIVTPLSSDHSFATFLRSPSLSVSVASRASHFPQSSPQYAINLFIKHSFYFPEIRKSHLLSKIQRSRNASCSSVWNQCSPFFMTVTIAPVLSANFKISP